MQITINDNNNVVDMSAVKYGIKQMIRDLAATLYAYESDDYNNMQLCHLATLADNYSLIIDNDNITVNITNTPIIIIAPAEYNDKIAECNNINEVELLLQKKLIKCGTIRQAKGGINSRPAMINQIKYYINYSKYL